MKITAERKKAIESKAAQFQKDLKRMTKIYRSIPTEYDIGENRWIKTVPEKTKEMFFEAHKLFLTFAKNWEDFIFNRVLTKRNPDDEVWFEKEVRSKGWQALIEISTGTLFPLEYDAKWEGKRIPDLQDLKVIRQRRIAAYQRKFRDAFIALKDMIDYMNDEGEIPTVEQFKIGKTNIVIDNKARSEEKKFNNESLEKFLQTLRTQIKRIEDKGFPKSVDGLTITIIFDRKDLRAGDYDPKTDELHIYPLGFHGDTFTHEVGHRFYFRLPQQARLYWEGVIDGETMRIDEEDVDAYIKQFGSEGYIYRADHKKHLDKVDDPVMREKFRHIMQSLPSGNDAEDPARMKDYIMRLSGGEKVLLEEITDYATENAWEAYAEVFRDFIVKGPGAIGPFTMALFKNVSNAGGANVKASTVEASEKALEALKEIQTSALVNGVLFKTGKRVVFPFAHNKRKSAYMGQTFQQDIEPAGRYILFDNDPDEAPLNGWAKGTAEFKKPLVIVHNTQRSIGYDDFSWKALLHSIFKSKGKALAHNLKRLGFDGVVTVNKQTKTPSEIVEL